MSSLRVSGLEVELGGKRVLSGIGFMAAPSSWTCIIGPNGSGKTTALKAVTGLVDYRGVVDIDGIDPVATRPRDLARKVALVPQSAVIPPGMPLIDYVLLGRTPHIPYLGAETRRDLSVAADLLEQLDLEGMEARPVDTLSGGELQRTLFARALAQEAPILLLDEPTAGLDIGHQQDVLELVDRLRRDQGLTILSTMHDLTVAGQFADQLLLLDEGSVVASGSPREVLTEENIRIHYRAAVEVIDTARAGVIVVPVRSAIGSRGP